MMVAPNFTLQDLPYAHLLQVSDEDREFLTLEELKPHQLTELSGVVSVPNLNGANNNQHVNLLPAQLTPPPSVAKHERHLTILGINREKVREERVNLFFILIVSINIILRIFPFCSYHRPPEVV